MTQGPSIHRRQQKKHSRDYGLWFHDSRNAIRGETALWIAVITQALMDALSRTRTSEALYHKHEAIRWLSGNSKDFVQVCLFAGLDPDYVRRKAKRALLKPVAWRASPGKGKRYLERKAYRERIRLMEKEDSGVPPKADVIAGPWPSQAA